MSNPALLDPLFKVLHSIVGMNITICVQEESMFENKVCDRVKATFTGRSPHTLDLGIGVNWHQNWFGAGAPADSSPAIEDAEHWGILLKELSFVKPAFIRFGYMSPRFVREDGSFNWDAEGFKALRLLNDWAIENHAALCFDPWMIPPFYSFGTMEDGIFFDAPADIGRFVDGFVIPLIRYIKEEMKLEAVTHFILLNEPLMIEKEQEHGFAYCTPPGVDRFAHYVECHRQISLALKKNNLDIKVIGPDTNSTLYWAIDNMLERGLDISPWIDALDQHSYWLRFDYLPPNPAVADTVSIGDNIRYQVARNVRYARAKGKPYYITEMGTFYYGWRTGDPFGGATHEAFILESEFIVRALKVGCGGFLRWAFISPGEYGDGVWQFVNTVDGSYTRQANTFYGYSGLMRYTMPGSCVWIPHTEQRTDPYEHVHVVGLELPDGGKTILVVNDHNCQERVVELNFPQEWWNHSWQKFLNDRTRKMHRREMDTVDSRIEDVLPPMSLVIYTTRRLRDDSLFLESSFKVMDF